MADDATTRKKMTNEQFLQGYPSIQQECFDFNLDSEDEENEEFTGDVCFKEKCQSTVVDDLCNIEPLQELTDDQWTHMKEQADLMVFLLGEAKQLNNFSNTPAASTVQNSHNLIQSPQVTSSPAMNTRSKRKMQLISGSPYKVSPLQDITNRSTIKPFPVIITPQSIQKLASSKLETATDLALYDQLGLVNPMRLNFDDVEHSPKKSRCLNPYFTRSDSPLLTDETWDVLLSSPDVNQSKAVRESLGLNARMSSNAILKKSRIRSKLQLISGSPYKVSPLQDITNRSTIKPFPVIITPQSIQKLASSKLETATDLALYDQLGLVNPMRLNFDDVEHSPKKSRCLNPYFTRSDSPLLTDETWDVLLSSPDVNQSKAVRESLGLNARMSSNAILKKSRIRSKLQLISGSPYKVSPLQDITNRSTIKPFPVIITPQRFPTFILLGNHK